MAMREVFLCIEQDYLFTPKTSSHFPESQLSILIPEVIFIVFTSHQSY